MLLLFGELPHHGAVGTPVEQRADIAVDVRDVAVQCYAAPMIVFPNGLPFLAGVPNENWLRRFQTFGARVFVGGMFWFK
jgi:hypothetical protein